MCKINTNNETENMEPADFLWTFLTHVPKMELDEKNEIVLANEMQKEPFSPKLIIQYDYMLQSKKANTLTNEALLDTIAYERQSPAFLILGFRLTDPSDYEYVFYDEFYTTIFLCVNVCDVGFGHMQVDESSNYAVLTLCLSRTIPPSDMPRIKGNIIRICDELAITHIEIIPNEELITAWVWGYETESLNHLTEEEKLALPISRTWNYNQIFDDILLSYFKK